MIATSAPVEGPPVERMIVKDMLRRGWPALVALTLLGGLWGLDGVLSAGFGTGVAVANAVTAAALVSGAAKVSLGLLYAAALGGYLVRLGLITVAVLAVAHQPWAEVVPLCATLVIAHLGLFVWEARFVSTQLAFPGLKPRPKRAHVEKAAP
ncbi:MAG: hypothetical protein AVDCRST_MAG76-2688 [uncultured Acidimicrobiales bacterium]|uniref:ATP synthase subunit I n=1 Tax=uncultured Acidimicrobiales bacterium TaxID=310071 RepID=A0A6J4ISZ5_9ACTN|nr:MAG: hypothetical protein AVDCRST_MAG76-2688 [uncultured Acidimicrobiales bacterium]